MTKPVPGAKKYMAPEARKQQIFDEAWRQAVANGLRQVTRVSVTTELSITAPMVNNHFGTMSELHRQLAEHAVKQGNAEVVADAMAMGFTEHEIYIPPKLLKEARRLLEAA